MSDAKSPPLPPEVTRVLDDLVAVAREALAGDMVAAVLFGSAAEGRMRATSDVNLILVLRALPRERLERLRPALAAAQAAVRLRPMFLLEREIGAAASAFAVKFADIVHRRRVLWGEDPFVGLVVPRAAIAARLRQVLLNSSLHLREAYLVRGVRGEQLVALIADSAGPLRASAAALLELEGTPAGSPREALARVAADLPGGDRAALLAHVSEAREREPIAAEVAGDTVWELIELADRMRERAQQIT